MPQDLFCQAEQGKHIPLHPTVVHFVEFFCSQVKDQDIGSWLQGGQELLPHLSVPIRIPDLE